MAASALTGCSNAKWQEVAPHTGDPLEETKTTAVPDSVTIAGERRYVIPVRLRARTSPEQAGPEAPFLLEQNDVVEILDPNPVDGLIKVRIVSTQQPTGHGATVYVPARYLDPSPIKKTNAEMEVDRYFVVQNIATERLRVYERCTSSSSCSHRLVLEVEMVAGLDQPKRRSLLGSYRLTKWYKFYEDFKSNYPSWYNPSYPQLPAPGAGISDWANSSLLPGFGEVRGMFGWYTAFIGPNSDEQWMHGTLGWGADGNRFIETMKQPPYSKDERLASHGCTRVENQAIAFMREILPPGTRIIKIYAREALRKNPTTTAVPTLIEKWRWILTKDGVDIQGPGAERISVLVGAPSEDMILEEGAYSLDQTPNAFSGNVYGVSREKMKGVFMVDEGRLVDYQHPKALEVGGYLDSHLPSMIIGKRVK